MPRGTRPRQCRAEVWMTPEEMSKVKHHAKSCGMSISCYLREVGQAYQPKSYYDHEAVRNMLKINADQGRLGGLLKLWLSQHKGEGTRPINVRDVLRQIENLQQQMARLFMERVKQK